MSTIDDQLEPILNQINAQIHANRRKSRLQHIKAKLLVVLNKLNEKLPVLPDAEYDPDGKEYMLIATRTACLLGVTA